MENLCLKNEKENEDMADSQVIDTEAAEAVREIAVAAMQEEFSGPIPHPRIIKGYEEVLPGSADRIIAMAEEQATHRREMESIMIKTEARDSLLGILFAFSLGIGCIVAAVLMVYLVPQSAGAISASVLGVTGIGSITSGFIRSARGGKLQSSESKPNTKQQDANSENRK